MKLATLKELVQSVTGKKATSKAQACQIFWDYCWANEVDVNPDYINLDISLAGKEFDEEDDGVVQWYSLYRFGQPNEDNICSFLLVKEYDGGNCGTGFRFTGDNSDIQDLVDYFIN